MKKLLLVLAIVSHSTLAYADSQSCLATVIHNEAKGEDLKGKLLVAAVVLNRVESPDFPNTICDVVNQEAQFNTVSVDDDEEAYTVSQLILEGELTVPATTALYFHSGARPSYLGRKKFLFQHGDHFFYE